MSKDNEETIFANGSEEDLEQKTLLNPETRTEPGTATDPNPSDSDTHKEPLAAAAKPAGEVVPDRTSFAQEGMRIGVLLAYKFGKLRLGPRAQLGLRLSDPGLSTDGGVKARQSITLASSDKANKNVVIGWLDTSIARASLRPYDTIAQQYEQRAKTALDIPRDEYERFLRDLEKFFAGHGIAAETQPDAEEPASIPRAKPPRPKGGALELTSRHVIAAVIIVLSIGILVGNFAARCGTENDLVDRKPGLNNPLQKYKR